MEKAEDVESRKNDETIVLGMLEKGMICLVVFLNKTC